MKITDDELLLSRWRAIVLSKIIERKLISLNDLHNVGATQSKQIAQDVVNLGIAGAHKMHHRGKAVSLDSLTLYGTVLSSAQQDAVRDYNKSPDPCHWEFSSYKAFCNWMVERHNYNNRARNKRWHQKRKNMRQRLS